MKIGHLLLAISITAIWGVNFSVIKLGLIAVDPLVLAGIRFTLCALPAILFIPKPDVQWRYIVGYGLVFGIGLWGVVNMGIKAGLSAGIASLVLQFSAFFTIVLGSWIFKEAISRYQLAGIGIACCGLLSILSIADGTVTMAGLGLALLGRWLGVWPMSSAKKPRPPRSSRSWCGPARFRPSRCSRWIMR